jgi:hypothetical protein
VNEPPRLRHSGGYAQRLLQSASLDRPSAGSRRAAISLASTAGAFSRSASTVPRTKTVSLGKTLAKWVCIGAAAGGLLALGGSLLRSSSEGAASPNGAGRTGYVLPELPAAPPRTTPDIQPEGTFPVPRENPSSLPPGSAAIEPWVPSPFGAASAAAGSRAPSEAWLAEARAIDTVRDAVSRGDTPRALTHLAQYEQAHPSGVFAAEALALRMQALASSGKTREADALAQAFQRMYPRHPLSSRLKQGVPPLIAPSK